MALRQIEPGEGPVRGRGASSRGGPQLFHVGHELRGGSARSRAGESLRSFRRARLGGQGGAVASERLGQVARVLAHLRDREQEAGGLSRLAAASQGHEGRFRPILREPRARLGFGGVDAGRRYQLRPQAARLVEVGWGRRRGRILGQVGERAAPVGGGELQQSTLVAGLGSAQLDGSLRVGIQRAVDHQRPLDELL